MDRERREGLDNLADELIDNIIRTPDEEILNEVKEDCGDSAHDANRVRDLLDKSKRKIRLEKIKKAFTHPFVGGSVTDDVLWLTAEINKADKEIEFRNGVMNRQKSALDEKHKEIERLRNIAEETDNYDCGFINDYGGGNVQWWQDYIRSVIAQANEHWRQALL